MACIIPYSILSAYLTYFMFFIEAHTIVTLNHEKVTYKISAHLKKYSTDYKLTLETNDGRKVEDKFCIGKFITENNYVLADLVHAEVDRMFKQLKETKVGEKKKTK